MAKSMNNVDVKPGDTILVNNMMAKVKEVSEGGLLGATTALGPKVAGMVMPGTITCEFSFNFEQGKPVPCFVLMPNQDDK